MNEKLVFNRVKGLKFLYDNFPYLFSDNRIKLYFVNSKSELNNLQIDDENFDTLVLKRSCNKEFVSDLMFKDNRFFNNLNELKKGSEEFEDVFDFCIECHKFKKGENYYSDRLAIAQFSTRKNTDCYDRVNFIPSLVKGINTRDNKPYLEIEYSYNYGNVFEIKKTKPELISENNFDNYSISYLAKKLHEVIDDIRDRLIALSCFDDFQLIIRIDSYLNILPIDFRTPKAWFNNNNK